MRKNMRKKKKKSLKRDPLIMRKRDDPADHMMVKLDPDTHLEIFYQIPFKEAVQWRCVCKSWRTLLDDNLLINIYTKSLLKLDGYDHHHAHNNSSSSSSSSSIVSFISFSKEKTTSSLFGFYDDILCSYKESSFNDSSSKLEGTTMVNSCNGLICLSTNYYNTIAIYNPVTTEFLRLPCDGFYRTVLNGGFGYHPSTKEYKILRTIRKYDEVYHHQIYTLGTNGGWKDIDQGSSVRSFNYDVPGVHVNGVLYWITEYGSSLIMSFDLADEEFRILTMLPPFLNNMKPKPKPHYKLVESQGCLFLFVDQYFRHDSDVPHIELWVMKDKADIVDHNNGGFRYYWSSFMEITTVGHRQRGGDYEFLALTRSGKVLFWHNGVLTCFDPKTERFASISDVPASSGRYPSARSAIVPHTNSSVSFTALKGAIQKN